MPHALYLQSVDSRLAIDSELKEAGIEPGQILWRLMAHQAQTIRALRFGDAPIIVNQAMTGDGKSLAAQYLLFREDWPTFSMYPTNELVRDQERSVNLLRGTWATDPHLVVRPVNAATLDDSQSNSNSSRAKTLERQLDADLLLTNPDIFHLAMQFAYREYAAAPDIVMSQIAHRFRLFVFDEFHLFGAAQTASVMIALLLVNDIAHQKRPPRFLFLSATPQEQLAQLAAKAGLKVERIRGDYRHGLDEAPEGYRRILQNCTLTLYEGRLEAWVADHLDDVILAFYREHRPGAKGVIIANSVATAYRVHALLKSACDRENITLDVNTGLTPRSARNLNVNLLVATSTIDVGVDFRINLLIFESLDAATHLQRLGRLGRHTQDENGHTFERFEAHALLPSWVIEGIAARLPANTQVSREAYRQALEEDEGEMKAAFTPPQTFDSYFSHWAGIQAAAVLTQLHKALIRPTYESTVERLKATYKTLFPNGIAKALALEKDRSTAILDAARSFRGGSPFSALVLDVSTGQHEVVTYNLISLLLNAELDAVDVKEMIRQAVRSGQSETALTRSNPLAAYRLLGWLPKPRSILFYLDRRLGEEKYEVVIDQRGFQLDVPGVPELHALNRELETRPLAAILLRNKDPESLRRMLRLGLQIELFRFSDGNSEQGTVTFGRDALLLDSVYYRDRKSKSDKPILI